MTSISGREFKEGDMVLLFNSRLKLFPGKLRSRWSEPFKVIMAFPHGAVEVWSEISGAFKMNGQHLKSYIIGELIKKMCNSRASSRCELALALDTCCC